MSRSRSLRFPFVGLLVGAIAVCLITMADGEEARRSRHRLTQPLYRISKARIEPENKVAEHPLDPALKTAREGLELIRSQVRDYSCTLVKQERIGGVVQEPEYMYAEIRNRKVENGIMVTPFSVYLYFLKPDGVKGREVIYVEGQNNDKMVAHEGGWLKNAPAIWLRPDNPLAMRGNLYPITEAGIENLIVKLIEKAEQDRQRGECDVQFIKGAKINGRKCTVLQVSHPEPRPWFDFHIARIFIDDELNLPVRYAAYTWPNTPGGEPELLESYTYLNMKVNVGLTDEDFNHKTKFRAGAAGG